MFFPLHTNDPYASSVSLLLPMEGPNGSTTFADVSPSPKTVNRYGNTKISTAQSKWGRGSGYFDGTGDYLTVDSVLTVGTGDFCIEGWFRFVGLGLYTRPFSQGALQTNGSLDIELYDTNSGSISAPYPGNMAYSLGLSLNTWAHLALSRQSGLVRFFVNGAQKLSATQAGAITNALFYLGALVGYTNSSAHNLSGYVNDFRITENVARYTATFIPPGPLLASDYVTVAIPHFQPSAHLAAWRGL